MKKILLILFTLLSVVAYSQYPTKVKLSNEKTYATAYGAVKAMGPIIYPALDTLSSLVGNPLYDGATVYKDGTLYINNGLYWEPLNPSLAMGYPFVIHRGMPIDTLLARGTPGAIPHFLGDSTLGEAVELTYLNDSLHVDAEIYFPRLADGGNIPRSLAVDGNTGKVITQASPINNFKNGVIGTNGIGLVGSTLTITAPINYMFNNNLFTEPADQVFTIDDASTGYFRTDIIWIDSTGTFHKTVGTEDTVKINQPEIDYNGIVVTIVDVHETDMTSTPTPASDYWGLNGNTFGATTPRIGSIDNKDMNFITGNITRMALNTNGDLQFFPVNGSGHNHISILNNIDPSVKIFSVESNSNLGRIVLNANNSGYISGGFRIVKGPTNDSLTDGAYVGLYGKFYDKITWNSTNAQDQAHDFQSGGVSQFSVGSAIKPGILIARISTGTRDGIVSPATGLLIYNTTTNAFNYYDGSAWTAVGGGSGTGWGLEGSTGTDPLVNFIGTTDDNDVVMKRFNTQKIKFTGGVMISNESENSTATNNATTIGNNNTATGANSLAAGFSNQSTANRSAAIGYLNTASGVASIAMGHVAISSGTSSIALGENVTAKAFGGVSVGSFNDVSDSPDPNVIDPLDRIFQIGNGNSVDGNFNALTILRNGNIGVGTLNPSATVHLVGTLRIVDGNEGLNKVLTSDADGNATWQTPSGGSSGTRSYTITNATAGQTAFTFTSVPSGYEDYLIFRNGVLLEPVTEYSTSGNIVTLVSAASLNDRIRYQRLY